MTKIANLIKIQRISLYIFFGLLAYAPLHIFISTWLGTSFGILMLAKVLKDIVLVFGFGLLLITQYKLVPSLLKNRIVQLIVAYGLLTIVLAVLRPTDQDAELLGVVYNTRFLIFLLYAGLLASIYKPKYLLKRALQIVIATSFLVAAFGVVQYLVLPNNALTHFGYSRANGVLPAFFIDDKPNLERVMSTVRDPNTLGSYLIITIMLCVVFIAEYWHNKPKRRLLVGLLGLSSMCIVYTFSRSAIIGLAAALITFGLLHKRSRAFVGNNKYKLALCTGVVAMSLILVLFSARNSYAVQNLFLHADSSTKLENPNQLRVRFYKESAARIIHNPLGSGPGTAGLASIRNNKQGVVLNENYYLQIAQEVGILGLVMFAVLMYLLVKSLLSLAKTHPAALALLCSLIGLILTNLLVHIWSNEAVAYTWWGLAGLVIPISNKRSLQQSTKV